MSSPERMLSSSPRSVKIDTDPSSWQYRSNSNHSDDARHSPTAKRAIVLSPVDDADALERQRRMDADSAMQLSRARSASLAQPQRPSLSFGHSHHSHTHPHPHPHSHSTGSPHMEHDHLMSMLSPHEEEEVLRAQGVPDADGSSSLAGSSHHITHPDLIESLNLGLSRSHHSLPPQHQHGLQLGNINVEDTPYQPSIGIGSMFPRPQLQGFGFSKFDFSHLESFSAAEKQTLGIATRENTDEIRKRLAGLANGHGNGNGNGMPSESAPDELIPGLGDHTPTFVRKRQRKLSQSNTTHPRRQNKLALFEGAPPPTDTINLTAEEAGVAAPPSNTGHDRPYRFSFYSNRLSATIHARSLSELPADGQTFEELFLGSGDSSEGDITAAGTGSAGKSTPMPVAGAITPEDPAKLKVRIEESKAKASDDEEVNTWWLDVLSPTNDEMAMLSKVFNIHPLTTEDIQMEETREKIELFRNYYLVCFRGFDQDPYSPTHLEPLNMYIIVFREGILSFHFRGTPHPQNVRRRIKQLKDYISVTSDWISYALIDDITDAFGPLIQGIEYEVDSIDELVLILKDTDQSDMLRRIGTCRKKVMGLLRLMGNKADVVKGLAKRCNENWSVAPKSDIGLYLSDIQDHLITMTQNLNHYEKILSRSHSNYLAQISIEMTDANNQINDVLSKLTALGTVLIPMNLVTGLWGMNVHVPGEDLKDDGDYRWFISIIGGLVGFGIIGSWLTYKLMRNS
ncbi:Putative metal ion transporter C17A12,14 OS=Schizosaccharomyces pombe (strain 972 / ATCC 24843) GN=SPAC17A2.14 PE=1 SV=4 [Rhizoctonia solani AG-1 IB]|uniref:Putative metal ion transporter C17A12,14 n=1 Tax=Thanatephorus cucumeris (strain AG1-IB / isolate 7/3/14) TaxID=1108050 RepID=A0A0B7G0W9_THACB|nr:Putative metal ion transporter C17A12,14 OS=Schizosaccharomyces pombe (strain 972 / ATCC 24843) GN=SPAC17A2.14 PE=1 SV=4 [Rhizoctonia solani AG-1 IB]